MYVIVIGFPPFFLNGWQPKKAGFDTIVVPLASRAPQTFGRSSDELQQGTVGGKDQ